MLDKWDWFKIFCTSSEKIVPNEKIVLQHIQQHKAEGLIAQYLNFDGCHAL